MSEMMPNKFDRLLGQLTGLPDTLHTKPSTLRVIQPLGVGGVALYVVQTYRQQQRDEEGRVSASHDTIFLEVVDADLSLRIALPAAVADTISRQRDALSGRSRSRSAKATAQRRMAAGELPGFLKRKKRA